MSFVDTPLDVPPDAIPVVEEYLLGVDEVVDLLDGRIATKSDSKPVYPYLTMQQFGATLRGRRLYVVSLQFDAWGTTRAEASLVARTVLAGLLAIRNYIGAGAVMTGATEELGVSWQPDTVRDPPTPRYVFGVAVTVHTDPLALPVS